MASAGQGQLKAIEYDGNMVAQQFLANGLNSTAYLGVGDLQHLDLESHRFVIDRLEHLFGCAVKAEFLFKEKTWRFDLCGDPTTANVPSSGTPIDLTNFELPKRASPKLNAVELSKDIAHARLAERRGKKNPIPRPMNRWMIWSTPQRPMYKARYPELTNQQLSTVMAADYKNLTAEELNHLQHEADKQAMVHALLYPDYKYQPRKPSERKRRARRAQVQRVEVQRLQLQVPQVQVIQAQVHHVTDMTVTTEQPASAMPTTPDTLKTMETSKIPELLSFEPDVTDIIAFKASSTQSPAETRGPPKGLPLADITPRGVWTPEDFNEPWRTAAVKRMLPLDLEFAKEFGLQEPEPQVTAEDGFGDLFATMDESLPSGVFSEEQIAQLTSADWLDTLHSFDSDWNKEQ